MNMMPSSKVQAKRFQTLGSYLKCLKTADLFIVIAKLHLILYLSLDLSDTKDSLKVLYTRMHEVIGVIVIKVL